MKKTLRTLIISLLLLGLMPAAAFAQSRDSGREERTRSFFERLLPLFQNGNDDNANRGHEDSSREERPQNNANEERRSDETGGTHTATSTPTTPQTPATTTPTTATPGNDIPEPEPTLAAIFPFFGLVSSEPTDNAGDVYARTALTPDAMRILLALSLAMAIAGFLLITEGRWRSMQPVMRGRREIPRSA